MVATPEKQKQYSVIGTRPIRHDGTDKVTGRAQYGGDIRLPGMLYGRVKRSPHAHAIIKKIDASRALALPGVKAVVTAADFPVPESSTRAEIGEGAVQNLRFVIDNYLAGKKALYKGHAVAAVCATDPHIAEDALDLIDVEYEVLTPVLDVRESMQPGAPLLHEDLRTRDTAPLADTTDRPSNIAAHTQYRRGDIEQGFAASDVIIEREYTTPMYHQGYIELQTGTAFWNKDGHLTVWTSTQGPFPGRQTLANALQLPVSQVTIVPMEIGGGFGGKIPLYLEPLAALLSRQTGKPVKMAMTREEVFEATGPTSGTYVRVKVGAKRDGTIVAAECYLAYEAGAYPGSPVGGGMNGILAPYSIPNFVIDGYDVVVNRPKTAAYRAPGTPAGMFPMESTLNELADMLDMDPLALRRKNASQEGDERPWGGRFPSIGNIQIIEAMQSHPHYTSELQGENRGRGVSLGYWGNAGMETSATASINPDGTLALITGSVDIGGSRASHAMMLAEALGIAAEDVHPRVVDTDGIGFNGLTAGSSRTFQGGWAMYELGQAIRRQLVERAARIWECDASQVTYGDDGVIRGPEKDGKPLSISFKEIAARLPRTGGTIEVGANTARQSAGPAFGGHIVDVEVDKDTGKVKVLRYTAFQDVGTAIHPSYVEGQIQGGAAQGIGMALTEEYFYGADGHLHNPTFLDYRMPTALDLPMIDTVLVEVPNPGHPYGVRGVGEVCIVPPLAAVQTAIAQATGVHFNRLPISPREIVEALHKDED